MRIDPPCRFRAQVRLQVRSAGLSGFEGAEPLASPWVIPGVGWLPPLAASDKPLRCCCGSSASTHRRESATCGSHRFVRLSIRVHQNIEAANRAMGLPTGYFLPNWQTTRYGI